MTLPSHLPDSNTIKISLAIQVVFHTTKQKSGLTSLIHWSALHTCARVRFALGTSCPCTCVSLASSFRSVRSCSSVHGLIPFLYSIFSCPCPAQLFFVQLLSRVVYGIARPPLRYGLSLCPPHSAALAAV